MTLLVLFGFAFSMYAGDPARKGTTGAEQLLIPVGAQGIATGGAMLAHLKGLESIYYNPAGLDLSKSTEAMFSFMNYIADINISYVAVSSHIEGFGSLALSIKSFDFGDIPVTTNDYPEGTGSFYSPNFMTFGLTYARVITDRISVGANFKLITESIENSAATGFGLDVGVQYRFDNALSLSASLKNIGSNMRYAGGKLQQYTVVPNTLPGYRTGMQEVVTEEFQIPSFFEMSMAYDYTIDESNAVLSGVTYTANNALEDLASFGVEYNFMKTFFVRGGYRSLMENAKSSIYGFSVGAGVKYEVFEGVDMAFDYAFQDVKEFPTSNHIFTMKFELK
jgi:opacity protein-like surface antigen